MCSDINLKFLGHVVIVPSWPLEAKAIVMTLDINNRMEVSGYCPWPLSCDSGHQQQNGG